MSTARKTLPTIQTPRYRTVGIVAWAAAIIFYGFGDTGTSIVSMQLGGIEASPIPLWFYTQLGYLGLAINKLLVIAICWLAWHWYPSLGDIGPDPYRLVIPILMTARGAWLVANNVDVILSLV